MTIDELIHAVEQLPAAEKWRLVKHVLQSLEQEQTTSPTASDWHQFLQETYGSLRESPIRRWDQGYYEERERLE
jgi:hypothetical protein